VRSGLPGGRFQLSRPDPMLIPVGTGFSFVVRCFFFRASTMSGMDESQFLVCESVYLLVFFFYISSCVLVYCLVIARIVAGHAQGAYTGKHPSCTVGRSCVIRCGSHVRLSVVCIVVLADVTRKWGLWLRPPCMYLAP